MNYLPFELIDNIKFDVLTTEIKVLVAYLAPKDKTHKV